MVSRGEKVEGIGDALVVKTYAISRIPEAAMAVSDSTLLFGVERTAEIIASNMPDPEKTKSDLLGIFEAANDACSRIARLRAGKTPEEAAEAIAAELARLQAAEGQREFFDAANRGDCGNGRGHVWRHPGKLYPEPGQPCSCGEWTFDRTDVVDAADTGATGTITYRRGEHA